MAVALPKLTRDAMAGRLLDHRRQLDERRPHRRGAEDDEVVGRGRRRQQRERDRGRNGSHRS